MTYADLVATAAVGTSQRPLPPVPDALLTGRMAEEPAAALLDAAAAYAVVRRAQLPVTTDVPVPEPAPADDLPLPPDRYVSALARLLGQLTDEQRTLPVALVSDLASEGLGWLQQAGWRLPDRLLVPVLQRAARDPDLALAAGAAIGGRGRWLAAFHPEWAAALSGSATASELSEAAWSEGDAAARMAYLTALRALDADRARDLVAEGWAKESVDDRVAFARVIAATASPSDEPFLTAALRDRSTRVAEAARPGLLRVPESALLVRLRDRARAAVTVRRGLLGRTVHLTPPDDDAAAVADGLTGGSYSRTPAENRLNALVASIPPSEWPDLVGVTATELLRAKADQSWTVVPGLVEAATLWRDAALADALVSAGVRTPALLRLLDAPRVAQLLSDPGAVIEPEAVLRLVESWPRPWQPRLAQSLGDWIQRQVAGGRPAAQAIPAPVLALAATAVPVPVARGWAHRLRDLAIDQRATVAVQRAARHAAAALTLRAGMYDDVRAAVDRTAAPTQPQQPYDEESR